MSDPVALTEKVKWPRTLMELQAASDECLRIYSSDGAGWVRTRKIGGTPEDRATFRLWDLVQAGYAEGTKPRGEPQAQWIWRITDAGRQALRARAAAQPDGEGE